MTTEVCEPKAKWYPPVQPGRASIRARGEIRLRIEDLAKARIKDRVVIELDHKALRMIFRCQLPGEQDRKSFRLRGGRKSTRCIWIERPLRLLGLHPPDVAGTYDVLYQETADRLEVSFQPDEFGDYELTEPNAAPSGREDGA